MNKVEIKTGQEIVDLIKSNLEKWRENKLNSSSNESYQTQKIVEEEEKILNETEIKSSGLRNQNNNEEIEVNFENKSGSRDKKYIDIHIDESQKNPSPNSKKSSSKSLKEEDNQNNKY